LQSCHEILGILSVSQAQWYTFFELFTKQTIHKTDKYRKYYTFAQLKYIKQYM